MINVAGAGRTTIARRSAGAEAHALRLLFLIDHLSAGGAERVLAAIAPRIAAAGHQVRVCVLDRLPDSTIIEDLRDGGIPVDRVGFRRLLDPWAYRELGQYIARWRPHVVHSQLLIANAAGNRLARGLLRPQPLQNFLT